MRSSEAQGEGGDGGGTPVDKGKGVEVMDVDGGDSDDSNDSDAADDRPIGAGGVGAAVMTTSRSAPSTTAGASPWKTTS